MTQVEQLAEFVARMTYDDLSEEARRQFKIHILDALGCAIGALEGPPISMLRAQLECLRAGIWGTKSLWGRVLTYKG